MTIAALKQPLLIEAVRKHALDNYEQDGWDILVECWSDEEIADEIRSAERLRAPFGAARRR